mmetsp:Transcript_21899/g.54600  ORF Transcript_21899/g.54600 Transcript_21899/m.54600 type:complete len:223 (-) Transcript_21899:348-1016(-)
MLKGIVLCRFLQIAMHLSCSRKLTLNASRGGGSCQVLLDHLGESWPLVLLDRPPGEKVYVEVGFLRILQVLLELILLWLLSPRRARSKCLTLALVEHQSRQRHFALLGWRRLLWTVCGVCGHWSSWRCGRGVRRGRGGARLPCSSPLALELTQSPLPVVMWNQAKTMNKIIRFLKQGCMSAASAYVRLTVGSRFVIQRSTQSSYIAVRASSTPGCISLGLSV